ncbi:MAG: hypothetical protein VR68_07540 [Peptococcaceae bacterium BRH_c4a]|nr:MAG: hypothetical protein VR68_07540 [Peptococcaceae bacterium BRH_c4a]
MAFFGSQHFLVKTKAGDLLDIYAGNSSVIYKIYRPGYKSPLAAQALIDDLIFDYDVKIDAHDNIHLVCITRGGELKYYVGQLGKVWNSTHLASLDMKSRHYRYLSLLVAGGKVHLFWLTASPMNSFIWSILHSFWNGREWREQQAGEIIAGKYVPPYAVDTDSQENLHLLYSCATGNKQYEAFYKRFNSDFDLWSHTERLPVQENAQSLFSLVDRYDNLHLLCSGPVGRENKNQISYRSRKNLTKLSGLWEPAKALSRSADGNIQPFLLCNENSLIALWKEKNQFISLRSEDHGTAWLRPEPINFPGKGVFMSYCSNYPPEAGRKKVPFLVGVSEPRLLMVIDDLTDIVPRQQGPAQEAPVQETAPSGENPLPERAESHSQAGQAPPADSGTGEAAGGPGPETTAETAVDRLTREVGEIRSGLDAAAAEGRILFQVVEDIENMVGELRECYRDLKKALPGEDFITSLEDLRGRLDKMAKELRDTGRDLTSAQQLITNLQKEYESSGKKQEELYNEREKSIKNLHQTLQKLVKDNASLQGEISQIREAREKAAADLSAREMERDGAWKSLTGEIDNRVRAVDGQCREAVSQLKDQQEEQKVFAQKLENMEETHGELLRQVETLQRDHQSLREEVEKQKSSGFLKKLFYSQ